MRRAWAILLLVVFSLGLIAPAAFASDPDANMPPCCRRAGEHKCSMHPSTVRKTGGPAFEQQSQNCAHYPGYGNSKTESRSFLPQNSDTLLAQICVHPALVEQTEARYRVSVDRTHLKRGPPARNS